MLQKQDKRLVIFVFFWYNNLVKKGTKKLSIAFYWHLHQPVYQLEQGSDFLMPWVRLHSGKDYLSMLLLSDKFQKLKLNFNIVPILLDALTKYSNGAYDIHSRLCCTDVKDLNDDDKEFILNNFFDVEYSSMVYPHEEFDRLYQKRFSDGNIDINDFSKQEYSDILAWFNLVWLNSPYLTEQFPEIIDFIKKGKGFTLEDRVQIIEIYRKIIDKIIPTFKQYLDNGKIEITTSPYFHPILPIMLNIKKAQKNLSVVDSTLSDLKLLQDAKKQVDLAINKFEEIFDKKPKGIWPAELGISPETLNLLKDSGVKWTISDEGILSKSINFDFVRTFKGHLEDPYHLMKSYEYGSDDNKINVIFRDSIIPNLINFEYSNHNPKTAANDLYDRIKVIQDKLQTSPDENHLLTIAMEGENCWENYGTNGAEFLESIYQLIENDESLETVLISDYLENKEKKHKELKKIATGSWINKNFQLWIGEPVKNLAWTYLKNVNKDFEIFMKQSIDKDLLEKAWKELLIAEGSDWFWWYGEPNDSGQDHIFDYLFREHLKNIYRYLGKEIPKYLDLPLISILAKPSRYPQGEINPTLDGRFESDEDWVNAGCVPIPEGPILQDKKLFEKICYGANKENFYLRMYLFEALDDNYSVDPFLHQMYIYMRNGDKVQILSPVRLINKTENVSPIMHEKFHNELRISMMDKKLYPIRFTKSIKSDLWAIQDTTNLKIIFDNVIDVCIPFDILGVDHGDKLEFFFANTNFGIKDAFSPQDIMINIQRP